MFGTAIHNAANAIGGDRKSSQQPKSDLLAAGQSGVKQRGQLHDGGRKRRVATGSGTAVAENVAVASVAAAA